MEFKLDLFFLLMYCSHIESISIGSIRNVSLIGEKGLEKNITSCNECACLTAMNTTFVSFNCYVLDASCEFFRSYNLTINYQVANNSNSIFYFIQLPPSSQMSKIVDTNTVTSQNAVIGTTLQSGIITTKTSAVTTVDTTLQSSIITTKQIVVTTLDTTLQSSIITTKTTAITTIDTTLQSSIITTKTTAVTVIDTTLQSSIITTKQIAVTTIATTLQTNTSTTTQIALTTIDTTLQSSSITTKQTALTTMMTTTTSTPDPCSYTAVGRCNSTSSTVNSSLNEPIDVFINRNGSILYVGEYGSNRVQTFLLPSKSGTNVSTSLNGPVGIYYDDDASKLYVTEWNSNKLSKWPSGQTLPLNTTSIACSATGGWFSTPYGVVGDRQGTIYVSHNGCHTIVKWTSNATTPILIAGTGSNGNSSAQLNSPRHMYLDEVNSFIYVADTNNHRIQRFSTNGNGTGVTVAGGNGRGNGLNQLNSPAGVYVSQKDGSIYISDRANNRIQKWAVNATLGVTVAGNSNTTAGSGSLALNQPYAVILDRNETYMYIADYNNNRVQRYPVV